MSVILSIVFFAAAVWAILTDQAYHFRCSSVLNVCKDPNEFIGLPTDMAALGILGLMVICVIVALCAPKHRTSYR